MADRCRRCAVIGPSRRASPGDDGFVGLAIVCLRIAFAMSAAIAAGCSGSSSISTVPSAAKCQISLSSAPTRIGPEGGSASASVAAEPECTWTVSTAATWITDLAPASGQGSGRIEFQVAPNPQFTSRQGEIVVNDQRFQLQQDGMACRFQVGPASQSLPAGGGTGTVTVTAASDCSWAAASNASWIAIKSGASGTGNGTVTFTAEANPGAGRSGTLTVAGQVVTVSQGISCEYGIAPTSQTFPPGGGTAAISVTAPEGCGWTATSNVPWVAVTSPANGSGNGTVAIIVAANNGAGRSGTVTIAGQVFTVAQAIGCTYSINPTAESIGSAGGVGQPVDVTTPAGCSWTATSNASWLTVASGAAGTGNGAVTFNAAANAGIARTGTLTIAGQTFTVAQASGCSASINPTSQSIAAAAGSGTVTVSTAAGCPWTAASNASWLSVTSGPSGVGNGGVTFAAEANKGVSRSGTLTIAGQNFTVFQASGCSYSINPTSQGFSAVGGGGGITVTAGSGCPWTANSNAGWISITSGASGGGNGTVTYLVSPNASGMTRTGTLTVAGQTFTITETH